MNYELRSIISGDSQNSERNIIQTIFLFIRAGKKTSGKIEESELVVKENEIERIILFANLNKFWYNEIVEEFYIGEGAEQKVYLDYDGRNVIKINDSIFYASWQDYLISLLVHNYLFPSTAYKLLGFYQKDEILYSVVKQPFVESTEPTDLLKLKDFLKKNGFENKKNNDYFNLELGIILEDLHDENVLTNQGVFFFIDTVIYLMEELN